MMGFFKRFGSLLLTISLLAPLTNAAAPSDSPRDADNAQSSYVGGDHNIDPETVSRFKQLWNASFNADEKHWARPLVHTLNSTGQQIVFTASTENRIRTFDATTGELLNERQVLEPWPMDGAYCTAVSKTLGIVGTPIIDTEYDIAFFYVKSFIEDYRMPGGANPPMNGVYYLYAVYLDTLMDLYKFPLIIDDLPADNDPRKIFIGGLLLQRPSLVRAGDVLYAGFGGLCDAFNYTGAIVAVNILNRQVNPWVTQAGPNSLYSDDWTLWHGGGAGGIWQAGSGLASDGEHVYFSVDNGGGSVDTNVSTLPISGKTHLDVISESIVRVKMGEEGVQLEDWFRPWDYQADEGQDIGSGGFAVLDETFKTSQVKRMGVATSKNSKMYIHDLDNLGGYRQGPNSSDAVLQTIHLDGEVFGGIGSYPLEGGYIYVNPGNSPLSAYKFTPEDKGSLFKLAGKASVDNAHWGGVGIPTITSKNGEAGSAIVWVTKPEDQGLIAYKAVPVNGSLVEIKLPKVEGANKYSRPVFGDGKVYVIDGMQRLVALGVPSSNGTNTTLF